jgi:hypothetical protein
MATDDDGERDPRMPQEVAKRVLALLAVVDKAHNPNPERLEKWVAEHKISDYFTFAEVAFFSDPAPTREQNVNYSWRAESLVPLCWALGLIDELPPLNVQMSWNGVTGLRSAAEDPDAFILGASLRPIDILDEAEQDLYHQHWRVHDAQLFGKAMPDELDAGIVYERRYAASWLVGWGDDWDNVPTDT